MDKKYAETLKIYFDLFMKYKVRTMSFFIELKDLNVSSITLYKYAKIYADDYATPEEKEAFKKLSTSYFYDDEASKFVENEPLFKKCFDAVIKFNGDYGKLDYFAQKHIPRISHIKEKANCYLLLSATEEEVERYNNIKQGTRKSSNYTDNNFLYKTIPNTLLSMDTIEEAINYLLSIENITMPKVYSYFSNYKAVNPDNLDKDEYAKAIAKLSNIQAELYRILNRETIAERQKKLDEINEINKSKRREDLDNILEYIYLFMNNDINADKLQELSGLTIKEITKLLEEFDPELKDYFILVQNSFKEQRDKHVLDEIRKMCKYLKNGININGQREEYSLFEFLISTDIFFDEILKANDKQLTLEEVRLSRKFSGLNKNTTIYENKEEIFTTRFKYIIDKELVEIMDDEKIKVIEFIEALNLPLYKTVVQTLFKRYLTCGLSTDVIEYTKSNDEIKKILI